MLQALFSHSFISQGSQSMSERYPLTRRRKNGCSTCCNAPTSNRATTPISRSRRPTSTPCCPRSSCCAMWWSRSATNGWPTTTAGSRNKRIPQVFGNVCPSLLSPDHSSAPGRTKLHRRHYRFPRPRIQYSI